MSLYATLSWFEQTLDGLANPDYGNAQAYVAPPVPGSAPVATPQLYIWPTRGRERRQTAPRVPNDPEHSGFKRADHEIGVFCLVIDTADSASYGPGLPHLIEAVERQLRSVPLPVYLEDTATAQVSQLSIVGEEFDYQVDVVRDLKQQALVRLLAVITCPVMETFQS